MNNEKNISKPFSKKTEKYLGKALKIMSRVHVGLYEKTNGKMFNTMMGSPISILTTIGGKSGQERKTPLIYATDGNKVIIVPSKLGMREPPAWQRNIDVNPIVNIQIGANKTEMIARVATDNEEQYYWPKMVELFDYEECRERVDGIRNIPIIVLEPRRLPVKVVSNQVIGVIGGTGSLGKGLAYRFLASGYRVALGSRDKSRSEEMLKKIKSDLSLHSILDDNQLSADDNISVASSSDIIIVAVPFLKQEETLKAIKPHVKGKIVVDVTVPLVPPKVFTVNIPEGISAGVRAQKILGDQVKVVSAFQNISSALLYGSDKIICDVLVTGNDKKACETIIKMSRRSGMNCFYAGTIENSLATEALTSVLIYLNRHYKAHHAGVSITGLEKSKL